MKINLFFLLLFAVCFHVETLYAQQAKTLFVQMPDSLSPLFTEVNRADFIDFLESKMKAEVSNRLGGKSEMTKLTPDFIEIRTTAQSVWQMKLLPLNDSTKVICTVSTVSAPVSDSAVRFYTTSWEELSSDTYLPAHVWSVADFIRQPADTTDSYEYQYARRQADMLLMKLSLDADEAQLVYSLTTQDYMEKEAATQLKPYLKPSVICVWKDGRFMPSE